MLPKLDELYEALGNHGVLICGAYGAADSYLNESGRTGR